jgi:uncharacterized protein
MINYFQIQRLASKKRVPEDVIEKDYFIELLLFYLSSNVSFSKKSIFRGGTSLKKIYFPDYRFSEDLDFIVEEKENLSDLEEDINKILIRIANDFPFIPSKISTVKNDRLQAFIKYNIIPEIRATKELKVDILKDTFIPSYAERKIIFTFPDFQENEKKFNSYNLESVAADKISRIIDVDKEARDIYDLWYLLKLDFLKISNLKDELKKRFGFKLFIPNLIKEFTSEIYRQSWKIRLEKQVIDLPPFELVTRDLECLIKNKLIN